QALVVAAFNRFQSGVGRDQALVERALELWGSGRADAVFGSSRLFTGNPGWRVAHMELALGEVDAARARIEALRAAAIELGGISTLPLAVARLSVVEWAAGNWELAHAYALEALEHAHQTGMEAARSLALAAETVIEAHRGRVDIVRERAAEGLAIGDASEILAFRCVLGFLELSLGNAADARSELEPIVAELEALGIREPCLPLPFRPDLVEALVALGELARAREVL